MKGNMETHTLIMTIDSDGLAHGICPEAGCDFEMWETPEHYARWSGGLQGVTHSGWSMPNIAEFGEMEVKDG